MMTWMISTNQCLKCLQASDQNIQCQKFCRENISTDNEPAHNIYLDYTRRSLSLEGRIWMKLVSMDASHWPRPHL